MSVLFEGAAARFGRLAAPAGLVVAGLVMLAVGTRLDSYRLDLGVTLLIFVVVAQSWNLLAGFSGQVSLGAAAFVGLGAYAATLLMLHTGSPWIVAVLAAAVVGALAACLLAIPLLRLRGDYFAVGTLASSLALQSLLLNWSGAGGSAGLVLPLDRIPSGFGLYRLTVALVVIALAVTLWVQRSSFGLRLAAVRDHEAAAAGVGVSVTRHRFAALVLSGTLTALAGSAAAFQAVAVVPDGVAALSWSLNAVLMAIVGGPGTLLGPSAGVLIVYYGLTKQLEGIQTLSLVIEGVLLIVIVRFAPEGVWPWSARLARRFLGRVTGAGAGDGDGDGEPSASEGLPASGRLEIV